MIPLAEETRVSYENFAATCPFCHIESIFNRASDLKTFSLIDSRDVVCLNQDCGKTFRITGDIVNAVHEMLIYDCYELIDRKHYMSCILNLAQAYEVFFGLYFRVELLYKPFGSDKKQDIDQFNQAANLLYRKIQKYTFAPMRSLFLRHLIEGQELRSLSESEELINKLPKTPQDIREKDIDSIRKPELVPLLRGLKTTQINILRNDVVHKAAYRPMREEVESSLAEARSLLFPLTYILDLKEDVNWYMNKMVDLEE